MHSISYGLATVIAVAAALLGWTLAKVDSGSPRRTSQGIGTARSVDIDNAEARNAEMMGKPPRISPLARSELKEGAEDSINRVRKAISLPPMADLPPYIAIMAKHPDLYEARMVLADALFHGSLSPHDRELAILRIAWLCQAPFEWGDHVKIGKREGKLTDEEVARITVGPTASDWSESDYAILRAVDDLYVSSAVSDATWEVLAKHLNEKQLIELPLLVGQYQAGAYLKNTLRVPLMPGSKGLAER